MHLNLEEKASMFSSTAAGFLQDHPYDRVLATDSTPPYEYF